MLTALAVLAAPAVTTIAKEPAVGSTQEPRASKPDKRYYKPAETKETQADVFARRAANKQKGRAAKADLQKRKSEALARQQMQLSWMQMQVTMRQADRELEYARLQAARMEGIERREAQERTIALEAALSEARAMESQRQREYILARDDPEQYRHFLQAQLDAYNAQQQAFQRLGDTLAQALQERRGWQGQSEGIAGGTSGSASPPSPAPSPGNVGQPVTPGNAGGGGTYIPPSHSPTQNNTNKGTNDDIRKMMQRNH